jgi:hypothetical protein
MENERLMGRKKQMLMSLKPTAIMRLNIVAEEAGLSCSEFLECVLMRLIELKLPSRFTRFK